jgi:DNA-binding protein H-NS
MNLSGKKAAKIEATLGTEQAELQTELAVAKAKRETEVATLRKEAELKQQVMQAKAEQEMRMLQAEADLIAKQKEAQGQRALLEAQGVTAKILQENPALLQLELAKQLSEAMKDSQYLPVATMFNQQSPLGLMMAMMMQLSGGDKDKALTGSLGINMGQLLKEQGLFKGMPKGYESEKTSLVIDDELPSSTGDMHDHELDKDGVGGEGSSLVIKDGASSSIDTVGLH